MKKCKLILYITCICMYTGSYTKASVIWHMYTCECMHVYKEALSVSTRKGTNKCESAQPARANIQTHLWRDICILVSICMNTKRFYVWAPARAQTYVSLHSTRSYTKASVIWHMYTCECMHVYKEALSVSTRKGTNKCESAQQGLIYKRICDMIYVYLWAYVCTQRGSKCEPSHGKRHTWVRTTFLFIYIYI